MNNHNFNLIPQSERVIPDYDASDRPGLILTARAKLLAKAPAVPDAEYARREAEAIAAYRAATVRLNIEGVSHD